MTKASKKAVKDAISRSCLCGLSEVLGMVDFNNIRVNVSVATPYPEQVNKEAVLSVLPFGQKYIEVKEGGWRHQGC